MESRAGFFSWLTWNDETLNIYDPPELVKGGSLFF